MGATRDHQSYEKRRFRAVGYFEQGLGAAEVARRLGVKRQSAHAWKKSWEAGGRGALKSKGAAGRKSRLSPAQRKQISRALVKGPQAQGYATQVWTLPRVRSLISKTCGESYHTSHLSRILRSLGFSCQRPERRAIERDEKAIARWKRVQWPAIKKKRKNKDV
jgi:transposase